MSDETSGTAPKVDPEDLALRTGPRPVRRINRKVLILLSGTGLVLIFGAVFVALDPPHLFDRGKTGDELYRTDNNPTPEGLDRLPSRYSDMKKPAVELGPPMPGDMGPAVAKAERDLGVASSPDLSFRPDPEADAARAERIRQARMAQQGRESGVFFRLTSRTAGTAQTAAASLGHDAPSKAAQQGQDQPNPFDALPVAQVTGSDAAGAGTDQNGQAHKLAFLNGKVDDDIYNAHALQDPASRFEVMAGTIIPASLISGLNSDLPGKVIAQVTENVYDTPTGKYLLIPQGTRVIGAYDSTVAFGQKRALVVWQRIIMPDGSSVVIDNLPATDVAGYAGLADTVDFHTWRLLKGVGLSTLLGIGTGLSFGNNESDLVKALRESAQNSANHAGQSLTERNLNIQPTVTIRPGWPLNIIVNKDIVLRPYGMGSASK